MPAKTLTRRPTPSIDYEPGETVEVDLPRSHFYKRLNLLCDYDVTVNTAGTPQNGFGILDLIDRIEVQFNGSQTLKSQSFATSHYQDYLDYATRPVYDSLDLSSATNQTGRMQTFVDFGFSPDDLTAMVPAFLFSDLTLKVSWGTPADIADDVAVNSASVAVETTERRKSSVKNPRSLATEKLVGFKERERTVHINNEGANEVRLPQGNDYYGISFAVLDGDSPSNDLIDTIEVAENGVTTHTDTTFPLSRSTTKQVYGVDSVPDGFATVDYARRANLRNVISTDDLDSFEAILNTEGTVPTDPAEVRVTTREIVR